MTSPAGGGTEQRNVQVKLGADTDNFQKAMDASTKSVTVLATAIGNLYTKIYDLTAKTGKGLTLIGTGSLAGLVGAAAAADNLHKAMAGVRTTAVLTGQSVRELTDNAEKMSRSIPMSTGAIAALMAQVQNLGIQGTENITRFTKVAAELAAATNTPPGQLFSSLIELGRTMGSSLADVERYGSALVDLSKQNGVSAQGVMDFSNAIQSVADRAGYTEAQVLGLSTAFNKAGADGFAAATVFTKMTTDISDAIATNSSQLTTYAALVGKTREAFTQEAKANPQNAFIDVLEAIKAQGPGATATLQQLGLDGTRAIKVIAALTSGQADLRGTMNQANAAFEANSATSKSSAEAWSGLGDATEKLKAQMFNLLATFGGPMATALTHLAEAATVALGKFADMTNWISPFVAKLAGIGAVALVVGGSILVIATALAKVGFAWRLLSSLPIANGLSGLVGGLRGMDPRENVRGGRTSQGIYDTAFRMGRTGHNFFGNQDPDSPSKAMRLFNMTYREPLSALTTKPGERDRYSLLGRYKGPSDTGISSYDDLDDMNQKRVRTTYAAQQARAAKAAEDTRIRALSGRALASEMASHPDFAGKPFDHPHISAYRNNAAKAAGMMQFQASRSTFDLVKNDKAVLSQVVQEITSKQGVSGGKAGYDALGNATSGFATAMRGAGKATGSLLGGVAKASGALFAFAPEIMIGVVAATALVGVFKKLHDTGIKAADAQKDFGEDLAQSIGLRYSNATKSSNNPADDPAKLEPFGKTERNQARDAGFMKSNSEVIARLKSYSGDDGAGGAALITQFKERVGTLDAKSISALRKSFLAAYGSKAAEMFKKSMAMSEADGDGALTKENLASFNVMIDKHRIIDGAWSGKASQRKFGQFADPVIQNLNAGNFGSASEYLQKFSAAAGGSRGQYIAPIGPNPMGAGLTPGAKLVAAGGYYTAGTTGTGTYMAPGMAGTDQQAGMNSSGEKFQAFATRLIRDYNTSNKLDDKNKIELEGGNGAPVNYDELVEQLGKGNDYAKALADGLKDGADAAKEMAAANKTTSQKMAGTTIGQMANDQGFNLLGPTGDVNFPRQLGQLENASLGGKSAITQTPQEIEAAIQKWRALKVAMDGNTDAMQKADAVIADLNQKLAQSRSFSTPFANAIDSAKYALQVAGEVGAGTVNYSDAKDAVDTAEGFLGQSVQNLRGYVMQVHEFHIQEKRGLSDHNLQLQHMERDHSRSLKEAWYNRNQSLKDAAHSYKESTRSMRQEVANSFSPFQHIDAQYTAGAQGALFNQQSQNQMLAKTKSGLADLKKMGVSNDVVGQLGLDNPQNFEQLTRFVEDLANNPKLVQQWNKSIKDKLSLSEAIATAPNNSKFLEMKRNFDYAANQAKVAFTHSMELADEAYKLTLSDFEAAYKTAQARAMADLQRTGENLFSTMDEILKGAADSGLENLQKYAATVKQVVAVIDAARNGLANTTPDGGDGTGAGPSVGGGMGGGTAVGDKSIGVTSTEKGPGGRTSRTTEQAYVNPGSGKVVGGRGKDDKKADSDFRPDAAFMREHPANASFNKSIAQAMMSSFGFRPDQFGWLEKLWNRESGWNQYADNGHSSAYGIPQALPGTKMDSAGGDWRTNPATQIRWGLGYIKDRYKSPAKAWQHSQDMGWYGSGGVFDKRQVIGVGEAGPEAVIPLNGAGASFISNVVRMAASQGMGTITRGMRTSGHATHLVHNGNVSTHYDHTTKFTGPVTVQAQDPNEMGRKLQQKKRMEALSRPASSR